MLQQGAYIFIVAELSPNWTRFNHVSGKVEPETMNARGTECQLQVGLKNWHSHLGSTSHPSQTNEAPAASKWDWFASETSHATPGRWILKTQTSVPSSTVWCREETQRSFQLHQYSLIHRESWQRLYPDGCPSLSPWGGGGGSEMEFKLEKNNSPILFYGAAHNHIYHLMMENFSIFPVGLWHYPAIK